MRAVCLELRRRGRCLGRHASEANEALCDLVVHCERHLALIRIDITAGADLDVFGTESNAVLWFNGSRDVALY